LRAAGTRGPAAGAAAVRPVHRRQRQPRGGADPAGARRRRRQRHRRGRAARRARHPAGRRHPPRRRRRGHQRPRRGRAPARHQGQPPTGRNPTVTSRPRLVLAYSGGLDTSVAIRWLAEHKGYDVVACAIDVGQAAPGEMDRVRQRALDCGAVESVVVDAKSEFADDFVAKAIAANALYMGKYPLVSALSRPLITRHLVRVARETGAAAIGHGCTGKGNDQVRFEVTAMAIAPDLVVEAPIREWGLSREAAIAWADERDIPIPVKKASPYSIDENLWGRTAECGILEDPWASPPEEV